MLEEPDRERAAEDRRQDAGTGAAVPRGEEARRDERHEGEPRAQERREREPEPARHGRRTERRAIPDEDARKPSKPPPLRAKKRFHRRRPPQEREPALANARLGRPLVREEERHRLGEAVRARVLEGEEVAAHGERQARRRVQDVEARAEGAGENQRFLRR